MLGRLSPPTVFAICGAFLEGPSPLQQQFLGMETYRATSAVSRCYALGPQGASATDCRVELKTLGQAGPAQSVGAGAEGPQGVGNLPG